MAYGSCCSSMNHAGPSSKSIFWIGSAFLPRAFAAAEPGERQCCCLALPVLSETVSAHRGRPEVIDGGPNRRDRPRAASRSENVGSFALELCLRRHNLIGIDVC